MWGRVAKEGGSRPREHYHICPPNRPSPRAQCAEQEALTIGLNSVSVGRHTHKCARCPCARVRADRTACAQRGVIVVSSTTHSQDKNHAGVFEFSRISRNRRHGRNKHMRTCIGTCNCKADRTSFAVRNMTCVWCQLAEVATFGAEGGSTRGLVRGQC